ncbi:MAG TPA: FHA domain-containing protein, partial [Kofleriaceae bacterium]|nr:FHA domain-containing protein [Kofleriaceae bacterium]
MKKFPDFVPPTKVSYLDRGPTLHLRRCILQTEDDSQEWVFDKEEIRLGSMEDNDVVLGDDTVSRYHCKI